MVESINVTFDERSDIPSELTNSNSSSLKESSSVSTNTYIKTDLDILFENFYDEFFTPKRVDVSISDNWEFQEEDTHNSEVNVQNVNATQTNSEQTPSPESEDISYDVSEPSSSNVISVNSDTDLDSVHVIEDSDSSQQNEQVIHPHLTKWTRNHPIHQVIGNPQIPV